MLVCDGISLIGVIILCIIYIYNSIVTLRHNIINSSASVPLNAKKIAVKKDCEVDLSMFGQEL